MLMTNIPMDHLVALAEERRARLLAEAEADRAVRRPGPVRRLLARLGGRPRAVDGEPPATLPRAPVPRGPAARPPAEAARSSRERPRITADDHDLCG